MINNNMERQDEELTLSVIWASASASELCSRQCSSASSSQEPHDPSCININQSTCRSIYLLPVRVPHSVQLTVSFFCVTLTPGLIKTAENCPFSTVHCPLLINIVNVIRW